MENKITVSEHDPKWIQLYKDERKRLKALLGKSLRAAYHIGASSVKGLASRPVIDILAIVKDISVADSLSRGFEDLGYTCCGEMGIENRRYFCRSEGDVSYNLQIFEFTSRDDISKLISMKGYLISHPDKVKEYSDLKTKLASSFPSDIRAYTDGKQEYLSTLQNEADKWSKDENTRSLYMSSGMCIGICVGTCFGVAFNNISLGMCLGLSVGMCMGLALAGSVIKRK